MDNGETLANLPWMDDALIHKYLELQEVRQATNNVA